MRELMVHQTADREKFHPCSYPQMLGIDGLDAPDLHERDVSREGEVVHTGWGKAFSANLVEDDERLADLGANVVAREPQQLLVERAHGCRSSRSGRAR